MMKPIHGVLIGFLGYWVPVAIKCLVTLALR
jgi:hypothetical protein